MKIQRLLPLICALFLLSASFLPLTYDLYQLLRWLLFFTFLFFCFYLYPHKKRTLLLFPLLILTILYNPFYIIYFSHSIRLPLQIASAIYFLFLGLSHKK